MKTETINKVRELESEIIARAHNCVKGETYVIVTKDMIVTVLNQEHTNNNQLISFPALCQKKQFNEILTESIEREKIGL